MADGPALHATALAVVDDRLLLVRHGHGPAAGEWTLPAARVGAGESLAEAVVRALSEQTGLEGICGPLLFHDEHLTPTPHTVTLTFTATVLDPRPPSGTAEESEWVPVDDVAERRLPDVLADLLHLHRIIPTIT